MMNRPAAVLAAHVDEAVVATTLLIVAVTPPCVRVVPSAGAVAPPNVNPTSLYSVTAVHPVADDL